MAKLTPMMQQYVETKKTYPDCILFYRLGDFYEMFFEDAITCSRELEITLTGKDCGLEERAPMCGVPYHAAENYLGRLIAKGYKVAICEQVEDPKKAKGLVKREVIRIVTPGTNLNSSELEDGKNNFLMAVYKKKGQYGISTVDVTTGDFFVTEVDSERKAADEVNRFLPAEIIWNQDGADEEGLSAVCDRLFIATSVLDGAYFEQSACEDILKRHFQVSALEGLGIHDFSLGVTAAGAVMTYLYETQKDPLTHLTKIIPYQTSRFMMIDSHTRRNLELTETLREKRKKGSLLWVLDKTKTAMGARTLRSAVEQPLLSKDEILRRLDAVEAFSKNAIVREELREYLNPVYDLERLIGRVCYQTANPRDLTALAGSLRMIPPIKQILKDLTAPLVQTLMEELDELSDITGLIDAAICEEPPLSVKEGGILKESFSEEVDELRLAKKDGKKWISELEMREREATGIRNLKIKFNKVFGFYFEVTNSYKELVPENWTRKQTLANAERYTTEELKHLEETVLGAEDKLNSLEYELFCRVREQVKENTVRIQKTAKAIAWLDMFSSLGAVAEQNQFVRPQINEEGTIRIVDGRHPVVEQMIPNGQFVANDTFLNQESDLISIITGPNMAGKSTYMRQTALIVLMAQIGSFVPAKEADIGIVDRIFTRVGASDDLASGQSTFMVEMTEVANILRNATKDSLIVLDEIGRGTSTFDGLAIAWAVVEHISAKIGAKTLFATHYHELTELEGKLSHVHNYCIAVKEQGDDIVFLRKIIRGGADKSYGIQVAKLAGVPKNVLSRAGKIADRLASKEGKETMEIVEQLKVAEPAKDSGKKPFSMPEFPQGQLSFFLPAAESEKESENKEELAILERIRKMDLSRMTPLEALNKLAAFQKKLK